MCNRSPQICSFVITIITITSFPHSWVTTGCFFTRVTRRVPPVEQERFTFPEHSMFNVGFVLLNIYVFSAEFCISLLVFSPFSFANCFVCHFRFTRMVSSIIYHLFRLRITWCVTFFSPVQF